MIPASSRDKGFQAKPEGDANEGKFSKAASTSRQWSGFRNPRIVRVSRSFGGKDRHSKVCTVRGLRDRRIRLSVPTAIQLYDLQDRLGLGQPSKVIDWLLDATKDDIDKLPPLQVPHGFGQFHQQMLLSHESNASQLPLAPFFDENSTFLKEGGFQSLFSSKEGIKINCGVDDDQNMMGKLKCWDIDASLRSKSKEVETISEKGKWIKTNEQEYQGGIGCFSGGQASAQKFLPSTGNNPSFPGLLNNAMPFNSYYHWDPANLSLSQFGGHGYLSQAETSQNCNSPPLSSSLALPLGSQLFFCPPATVPSLFPQYPSYISTPMENDPRDTNHFQLLSSSSQQHILPNSRTISSMAKPFSLNMNHGLVHSENNDENHPDKDNADS